MMLAIGALDWGFMPSVQSVEAAVMQPFRQLVTPTAEKLNDIASASEMRCSPATLDEDEIFRTRQPQNSTACWRLVDELSGRMTAALRRIIG
jgi:hypothetical protein